jgi:hypothetical protein
MQRFAWVTILIHQPQDDAFMVAVQAVQAWQPLADRGPAGGGAPTRDLFEQVPQFGWDLPQRPGLQRCRFRRAR